MSHSLLITLALCLAGFEAGSCSTVSDPPSPLTVSPGTDFKVRCGIAATSDPEGVRIKRIVEEGTTSEETVYQSLPASWEDTNFDRTKYSLTKLGEHDVEVTVKKSDYKDAGSYICQPMIIPDERVTVSIVVLGKPLLTLPTHIISGESFNAFCEVEFMAHPDIIQSHAHFPELVGQVDGAELTGRSNYTRGELGTDINSKIETVMNLTLTEANNGQNFTCLARTRKPWHVSATSQILDIKGKEEGLYTTCTHEADPDEMTGIGMNKTLGCYIEIEGLQKDVSYVWYKDGGELETSKGSKYTGLSTWKIVLHNLGKDDEGVYTCRIKNQVGLGKTNAAYRLTLPGKAELVGPEGPVISGQNIKLECLPGHPEKVSRLQWNLNGGALGSAINDPKPEDFIHSIQDVQGKDQGLYKCELTSHFGKDDALFNLDVYCKC